MQLLKYKIDNHPHITEASRRYNKTSKPKTYAAATTTNGEPPVNPLYVIKVDLEQTLEL